MSVMNVFKGFIGLFVCLFAVSLACRLLLQFTDLADGTKSLIAFSVMAVAGVAIVVAGLLLQRKKRGA